MTSSRGGADHRVLARDVVGPDGAVAALAHRADHVEIGKRRLHDERVGALVRGRARTRGSPRGRSRDPSGSCGGRRTRRRLGDDAKRAVEGGGVLGGVRDDRVSRAAPRGSRRPGRPSCRSVRRRRRRRRHGSPPCGRCSSTDSSLTISSPRTTPQCPWSVYSHRHTSVISVRSGSPARSARSAALHDPVIGIGARADVVLRLGNPEQDDRVHAGFERAPLPR